MSIWCNIFGHKWEKTEPYHQYCSRKKCGAFRAVSIKKYPHFGEPSSGWKVFEELRFKKQNYE